MHSSTLAVYSTTRTLTCTTVYHQCTNLVDEIYTSALRHLAPFFCTANGARRASFRVCHTLFTLWCDRRSYTSAHVYTIHTVCRLVNSVLGLSYVVGVYMVHIELHSHSITYFNSPRGGTQDTAPAR